MSENKHKDLGEIVVKLHWKGNGNQIILAKAMCRQKTDWFEYRGTVYKRTSPWCKKCYYCLWGSATKHVTELAPIECVTPTGRAQSLGAALKLFNQMVKSAETINMA
jgi:hypothetical protein